MGIFFSHSSRFPYHGNLQIFIGLILPPLFISKLIISRFLEIHDPQKSPIFSCIYTPEWPKKCPPGKPSLLDFSSVKTDKNRIIRLKKRIKGLLGRKKLLIAGPSGPSPHYWRILTYALADLHGLPYAVVLGTPVRVYSLTD